jgi:hypothetical protein
VINHLREWQQSGVDEELICLNVTPLAGEEVSQYLLYSDDLPRRNDGRVSTHILKQYDHIAEGGWWCSGMDLLTGEQDLWGCFKPNRPRQCGDRHKPIKYEHPPKTATGIFALRVPHHLWQRIADRSGVAILPQDIEPQQADRGFWQWLINHPEVPICITEGAKKAGAILTAGCAAIALPGINNGYRTPRDEAGKRIGKSYLIPHLQKLAVPGRDIAIAFDQDEKATTQQAVEQAIRRLGFLLEQSGATVKVMSWQPSWGKGIDDVIAHSGHSFFEDIFRKALPLDTWKAIGLNRLSYEPARVVNARYLPTLAMPQSAKLVGIQSPKGTGKTKLLEHIVAQAQAQNQRILVIGHRVRLVEELCQRFNIPYITEARDNLLASGSYGLCIDSLHPDSQAKFKAQDWAGSLVIIDEVEQVLWHGLNSETCKNHRVAILKSLKTLMEKTLGAQGQVCVADADLSDISLDYLLALGGISHAPYIIRNDWRPGEKESWSVFNYEENSPKRLIKDLEKHIREGGKPFVCLSAQKLSSQWGTHTLEAYLQSQFPDAKILRIDSESLSEPSHPAYRCIARLNDILLNYDIVVASPSIETGISIEVKGHFTSVWAIAQGVQTATSVCQAIGRIRDNVPRYLWVASYGFNQVGNGSTSILDLLNSGHRLTQLNIRLLQQSDLASLEDLDTGFQAESMLCWAKMAVRVNAAMINYRYAVVALLQSDNHRVMAPLAQSEKPSTAAIAELSSAQNQLSAAINAVRLQNYESECDAIANAVELSDDQYQYLKKRLVKTLIERRAIQKFDLNRRYCIAVTPQLVALDEEGWYAKLRLHYYLTVGRPYLADRDARVAKKLIHTGQGSLFLPDFNGSQLGAAIGTLEVLGIPLLLADPLRSLLNTDEDLQRLSELALQHRSEIKTILGIGLAQNTGPIPIVRRLLDVIGFGINCLGMRTLDNKGVGNNSSKRVRAYQLSPPQDGREAIFEQWLLRDRQSSGSSEPWYIDYNLAGKPNKVSKESAESANQDFVQLSLLDLSSA